MPVPARPKIYHIVHVDRLPSIIADGSLWSDAVMVTRQGTGTTIGMNDIKLRRLNRLSLTSHPDLKVGDCVPFYFCPRSVMLYLLWQGNHPNLTYRGGQGPIVHLEADLRGSVFWAQQNNRRWAFTLSNAGAYYFEDRCNLDQLHEINWDAVRATRWSGRGIAESVKEGKQAEFLIHQSFPWDLVERVGVYSRAVVQQVADAMQGADHRPMVEIKRDWYY
jgi:ssDNA thymidine ADP-ribosyltransferase, DarT